MFCSADYYALLKNAVAARLIVNRPSWVDHVDFNSEQIAVNIKLAGRLSEI